jgi:hypothetical protein
MNASGFLVISRGLSCFGVIDKTPLYEEKYVIEIVKPVFLCLGYARYVRYFITVFVANNLVNYRLSVV